MKKLRVYIKKDMNDTFSKIKELFLFIQKNGVEIEQLKTDDEECFEFILSWDILKEKKKPVGRPPVKFSKAEMIYLEALLEETTDIEELARRMKKTESAIKHNLKILEKKKKG